MAEFKKEHTINYALVSIRNLMELCINASTARHIIFPYICTSNITVIL